MTESRDFTKADWSGDLPRIGDGPKGHTLLNDLSPVGLCMESWAWCWCAWTSEPFKSKMAAAMAWTAHVNEVQHV